MKNDRVVVLAKHVPTTKYCPNCGKLNKEITLADRTFKCMCGYEQDRDVHAAQNMILLYELKIEKNTCGTQEINSYGEDVRHFQPNQTENADLVELGSCHFYKWQ